jgi:outer membrane protein assembly factor BamB
MDHLLEIRLKTQPPKICSYTRDFRRCSRLTIIEPLRTMMRSALRCSRIHSAPVSPMTVRHHFQLRPIVALGLGLFLLGVCAPPLLAQQNWTRFRGDNGTGHSSQAGIPDQWTESDYEWIRELPGRGHSSPVIWGDALFLTSGLESGERLLICLDATTGSERWTKTIHQGTNPLHTKSSYASGTPAVDGERVYVALADEQHYLVQAYDFTGEQQWSRDLGGFKCQHGQGVSLMLYDDLLIVPNDQEEPSAILALRCADGETAWTTEGRANRETSFSTPMLLENNGRTELVCLSGATGVTGLDPHTGSLLWSSGELPKRTVASPVAGNGVIVATCGQAGKGVLMVAVEPGSAGQPAKVRYERSRELPYVPTPIVDGNYLYTWLDIGLVACAEMATGETVWIERVGGNYSGSPILIDGRLFCISEEGDVVVVAAAPEFQLLGRSPLGDASYATPAVANGRLYLRGFTRLACLKANEP